MNSQAITMRKSTLLIGVVGLTMLVVYLTIATGAWLNPDVTARCLGAITLTPPSERHLIPDEELDNACPDLERFSTPSATTEGASS